MSLMKWVLGVDGVRVDGFRVDGVRVDGVMVAGVLYGRLDRTLANDNVEVKNKIKIKYLGQPLVRLRPKPMVIPKLLPALRLLEIHHRRHRRPGREHHLARRLAVRAGEVGVV